MSAMAYNALKDITIQCTKTTQYALKDITVQCTKTTH